MATPWSLDFHRWNGRAKENEGDLAPGTWLRDRGGAVTQPHSPGVAQPVRPASAAHTGRRTGRPKGCRERRPPGACSGGKRSGGHG